jgi:cobalt-zinc-cadmium efflux system outer membrane protein
MTPPRSRTPAEPTVGRFFVALTVAALALPPFASGEDSSTPLDEREAVRRALARAPLVESLAAQVDVARADERTARTWGNPIASYGFEQTRGGGTTAREHTGTISVPLEISGARSLRADAAAARVQSAREEVRRERTVVASEARRRFFAVLWRDRRAAALSASAARLEGVASATERREASGDVSAFDAALIVVEREAQRARAAAEAAAAARARALLAATIGEPLHDAARITVAGELSPGAAPELATFLDRVPGRADLRALQAQEEAGELAGRAAARSWIPPLELGAGVKYVADGGTSGTGPVVGISIPLPLFDRAQGEAARASAEQRRAAGRSKLVAAEAAATVAGLHAEAAALADVARRSQTEARRRAEVLLSAADAGYRGGELGAVELVDAYRAALDAELHQIDLAWNAREARIALDEAAGLVGDEEPNS